MTAPAASPTLPTTWSLGTLGPAGTDHERAAREYARTRLDGRHSIHLLTDFAAAGDFLAGDGLRLLVVNSAHQDVDLLVTRDWRRVAMVDFFALPTMPLALVKRADVARPTSIALMPATRGYLDLADFSRVDYVSAKPIALRHTLAGRSDAAIVSMPGYHEHRDELDLVATIGPVVCCWLVFGRPQRVAHRLPPLPVIGADPDPGTGRRTR